MHSFLREYAAITTAEGDHPTTQGVREAVKKAKGAKGAKKTTERLLSCPVGGADYLINLKPLVLLRLAVGVKDMLNRQFRET